MAKPVAPLEEALVKQVATASLMGSSINQIAEQLKITRFQVRKIQHSPEFADLLKSMGDESISSAKQLIRARTSEMATEVTRVLMEQLKENNLEAVKIALRVLGFDNEEKQVADTQINVVLPGVKQEIIVPSESSSGSDL